MLHLSVWLGNLSENCVCERWSRDLFTWCDLRQELNSIFSLFFLFSHSIVNFLFFAFLTSFILLSSYLNTYQREAWIVENCFEEEIEFNLRWTRRWRGGRVGIHMRWGNSMKTTMRVEFEIFSFFLSGKKKVWTWETREMIALHHFLSKQGRLTIFVSTQSSTWRAALSLSLLSSISSSCKLKFHKQASLLWRCWGRLSLVDLFIPEKNT